MSSYIKNIDGSYIYREAFFHYSNLKKIKNLFLAKVERKFKKVRIHSFPFIAGVEVCNYCVLNCKYCPTGIGAPGRSQGLLDFGHFQKFIDEIGDYLYIIHLYNKGEPLLHPKIGDFIQLSSRKNVFTSISSNLNIKKKEALDAICDTGLNHIIVSIDGITQSVYEKYRKGACIELALNNLAYLIRYKKENKLKKPFIEWRYLIFDHNQHELNEAKNLAAKLGVDGFSVLKAFVPDNIDEIRYRKNLCPELWKSVWMQVDGGISPCANLIDKKDDFSHIDEFTVKDCLNNERFLKVRNFFGGKGTLDSTHPCFYCPWVQYKEKFRGKRTKLEMIAVRNSGGEKFLDKPY